MGFFNDFAMGAAQTASDVAVDKFKKSEEMDKYRQELVLKTNAEDELKQREEARKLASQKDMLLAAQKEGDNKFASHLTPVATSAVNLATDSTQTNSPFGSPNTPPAATITTTDVPPVSQQSNLLPTTQTPAPQPDVEELRRQRDAHYFTAADLDASANPQAKALATSHKMTGDAYDKQINDIKDRRTQAREPVLTIEGVNPVDEFLKEEQARFKPGTTGETQYLAAPRGYNATTSVNNPNFKAEQKSSGQVAKALDTMTRLTATDTGQSSMAYAEAKQSAVNLVRNKNIIIDKDTTPDQKQAALQQNMEILSGFGKQGAMKLASTVFTPKEWDKIIDVESSVKETPITKATTTPKEDSKKSSVTKVIKYDNQGNPL